jgi:putative membrane protein
MLLEIAIFLLLGVLAGTLSGLFPGIHINLIGTLLVSLSTSILSQIELVFLVTFIAAMAITHTFVDFIPSIFLGCPNTDTELSVLPGHEMLKEGEGYGAIMLTARGCLSAVFILLLVAFPLIVIVSKTYDFIKIGIPYILIAASIFLIFTEKNKLNAFLVFSLTGILGYCTLNLELKESLLPLLSGLFGASTLILSIKTKTQIPKQKISELKTSLFKPLTSSLIASPLCGFLPGLGSGQATIIASTISKTDKKSFLVLLGATNLLVMGFSFISLYTISKSRTGAAVAVQNLIGTPSWKILVLILAVILISGIISFFLTKFLAKILSRKIDQINYSLLSLITLGVLTIVVFTISGFLGLIVLIVSTFTGIYCITLNVKRTNMMGCLLLPTIILYLF